MGLKDKVTSGRTAGAGAGSRAATGGKRHGPEKILSAAEALFAKRGFEAVTLQEIAKASRHCQANIIYHFKSKKELYLACLRAAKERLWRNLDARKPSDGTKEQLIRSFAASHLAALMKDEAGARLLYREVLGYGPIKGKEMAEKVVGRDLGSFVERLSSGGGPMRMEVDPAVVAFLIIGMNALFLHAAAMVRHLPGGEFVSSPERFHQEALSVLLYGAMDKEQTGEKS